MPDAVFHRLDYQALLGRLRTHAAALGARPEVHKVVLIGSLARGDWSAGSDADLVILVDHHPAPGPFRGPEYVATDLGVGVDVLVFTPEEASGWSPRFKAEVDRGVVLFDRAPERSSSVQ